MKFTTSVKMVAAYYDAAVIIILLFLLLSLFGCKETTKDYYITSPITIQKDEQKTVGRIKGKELWMKYSGYNVNNWAGLQTPGIDSFVNGCIWNPKIIADGYYTFYGQYQYHVYYLSVSPENIKIVITDMDS